MALISSFLFFYENDSKTKVFCSLTDRTLSIFEDENSNKTKFNIQFTPKDKVSITNDDQKSSLHKFSITTESNETYSFGAETEELRLNWLNSLFMSIESTQQTTTLDDFEIIAVIGKGFFGKVMLAQHKLTKKYVAIKSIHKKELLEKNKVSLVLTERDILVNTKCPYIINLLSTFQTPSNFYLVLEYAPGGDLFTYLRSKGTLPLDQVRFYIAEIAIALHHLHKHSIIYRDLKPENILFCSDGNIKLTDFGISKILKDPLDTTKTLCGTDEYLPPEEIEGKPYSFAADWWQLGILMFEMIAGFTPFECSNKMMLFKSITKSAVSMFPIKDKNAKDLLNLLLKKDPTQRANFQKIKESAFFQGFDWNLAQEKALQPMYVPSSSSDDDIGNFDEEFTSQSTKESLVQPCWDTFEGFSFTSPSFYGEN